MNKGNRKMFISRICLFIENADLELIGQKYGTNIKSNDLNFSFLNVCNHIFEDLNILNQSC
jgi:hypothetical protein